MVAATAPLFAARRRLGFNPWVLAAVVIAAILLGPILAVFGAAAGDSGGLWRHLFETVLPRYVANTLILMVGVGAVCLVCWNACYIIVAIIISAQSRTVTV